MRTFLPLILLAFAPAVGAQDLTVFYPLDGDAVDVSMNGHHGTLFGAVPAPDRFGAVDSALHFDGNDRVDIPDDNGLTLGASDFTIMAWARASQASSDSGYYLLGQSNGPGSLPKWIFWFGNGGLSFVVGPTPGWLGLGAYPFQPGTWYHLVIRKQGSVLTGFVNGNPIGTAAAPFVPDSSQPLQLGTAEGGHPGRLFRGDLDDVRIYHRGLSDGEVRGIVEPGSSFCFGYACPCANDDPEAGCASSLGTGALLAGSGTNSVAADDTVLTVTGVPPGQFGIFFMGGGQAGATLFGDGKLCVNPGPTAFCRYPVQNAGPAGVLTQGPGMVALSQGFAPDCHIQAGQSWYFQAWYRDSAGPCGGFFNLSSALAVTFAP